MDNIKLNKNQLFIKVLDYLGLDASYLITELGVDKGYASRIINGKQNVSTNIIKKLIKRQPEINPEFLLLGAGEMLKSSNSEKKLEQENSDLEDHNFTFNLQHFIENNLEINALSELIRTETTYITHLLEQGSEPGLAVLIRLRNATGIPIDDWLFADFSDPEFMKKLKARENEQQKVSELEEKVMALQESIAAILEEMKLTRSEKEAMRKRIEDVEKKQEK